VQSFLKFDKADISDDIDKLS